MAHCPAKRRGNWDLMHIEKARRSRSMDIGNGQRWEKERRQDTVNWHLSLTEDEEHGDLGLRNFDSEYEYGSPEADRRVERLGYCRVHMPSVPNAGSSWFKLMFEMATGRPTASIWPEGGKNQPGRHYWMNDSPCGVNKFGGAQFAPEVCRNLTFPGPSDTVMVKSHHPFHPSIRLIDPSEACMVVLLVRNPLDTFKPGYDKKDGQHIYPFYWAMHNRHWVDEKDVPVFIFRYEDLVRDPQGTLERLLRVLPGFTWSKESISRAVEAYKPQANYAKICGRGSVYFTNRALTVMKEDFGGTLWRFGYTLSKEQVLVPGTPGTHADVTGGRGQTRGSFGSRGRRRRRRVGGGEQQQGDNDPMARR